MQVVVEGSVDLLSQVRLVESVVVRIVGDLVCVERRRRDLDRAAEAIVVVALMVGEQLDLSLGQVGRVHGDRVVHRQGSSRAWVVIGHHEEVEGLRAVALNNSLVDERALARVDHRPVVLLEEPRRDSFVDEHVQNLRIVARRELLNAGKHVALGALELEHLLLERRATDAVTIDDNLARNNAIVVFFEVSERVDDEIFQNVLASLTRVPLDLVLGCTFTDQFLVQRLMPHVAVVLRRVSI